MQACNPHNIRSVTGHGLAETTTWLAAVVLAWCVLAPAAARAQDDAGDAAPAEAAEANDADRFDPFDPNGVRIDVDFDIEAELSAIERIAGVERWDLLVSTAQRLLDRDGLGLVEIDRRRFQPVRTTIERRLVSLPPEALRAYRRAADPVAGAMLEASPWDPEVLNRIVRRYWLSRFGDDAAMRLASIEVDRQNWTHADRLLTRVLEEHPDPDIDRVAARSLLALARARRGDLAGAERLMATLEGRSDREMIARRLEALRAVRLDALVDSARRGGVGPWAPAADVAADGGGWSVLWTHGLRFEPPLLDGVTSRIHRVSRSVGSRSNSKSAVTQRQRTMGWLPSNRLTFTDEGLIARGHVSTYLLDRQTGAVRWFVDEQPPAIDSLRSLEILPRVPESFAAWDPVLAEEYSWYFDPTGKRAVVEGGTLYVIERSGWLLGSRAAWYARTMDRSQIVGRGAGGVLSAYDLETGLLKWRRVVEGEFGAATLDGGYRGVAVTDEGALIASYEHRDRIGLHRLDAETGEVRWDRGFAAIGVSEPVTEGGLIGVEGRDVYALPGAGLVVALGSDGELRWLTRYLRSDNRISGRKRRQLEYQYYLPDEGWRRPAVIPMSDRLVVAPPDAGGLLILNRRDGRILAEHAMTGMDFVLGVAESDLVIAGPEQVRRVDPLTGQTRWSRDIDRVTGLGVVTETQVLLPVGRRIVALALEDGSVLGNNLVVGPKDMQTIGNLAIQDGRLYFAGAGVVGAIGGLDSWLAKVQERVEVGDLDAVLTRARLHRARGEVQRELDDLRLALEIAPDGRRVETAFLLQGSLLREAGKVVAKSPEVARRLLDEAIDSAETKEQRAAARITAAQVVGARTDPAGRVAVIETLAGYLHDTELRVRLMDRDAVVISAGSHAAAAAIRRLRELGLETPDGAEPGGSSLAGRLAAAAGSAMAAATGPGSVLAVWRAFGETAGAVRVFEAAESLRDAGQPEAALLLLAELERDGDRATRARAVLAAAEVLAGAGGVEAAIAEFERAAGEYGDVPASWRTPADAPGDGAGADPGIQTVDAIATARLAALSAGLDDSREDWALPLEKPGRVITMGIEGSASDPELRRLWLFASVTAHELSMVDTRTGRRLWSYRPSSGNREAVYHLSSNDKVRFVNGMIAPQGVMPRDGYIGMLWAPGRVQAIGLLSGAEAWREGVSIALDASQGSRHMQFGMQGDRLLAVGEGWVASLQLNGFLEAESIVSRDTATGALRWRREMPALGEAWIWDVPAGLVVVSQALREAWLLDPLDGRMIRRLKLPLSPDASPPHLAESVLAVQTKSELIGVDVTTGHEVWRRKLKPEMQAARVSFEGQRYRVYLDVDPRRRVIAGKAPGGDYAAIVDVPTGAMREIDFTTEDVIYRRVWFSPDMKRIVLMGHEPRTRTHYARVVSAEDGSVLGSKRNRDRNLIFPNSSLMAAYPGVGFTVNVGREARRSVASSRVQMFAWRDGEILDRDWLDTVPVATRGAGYLIALPEADRLIGLDDGVLRAITWPQGQGPDDVPLRTQGKAPEVGEAASREAASQEAAPKGDASAEPGEAKVEAGGWGAG